MGADLGHSPPKIKRSSEATNSDKSQDITNFLKINNSIQYKEKIESAISYIQYEECLDRFIFRNNKLYALTISPKAVPAMDGLPIEKQYNVLKQLFRNLGSFHNVQYIMFIELYKDLENIHVHGFIQIETVKEVAKVKQYLFERLMKRCRNTKESYKPLLDCQQQGIDNESVKRWKKYCLKDQLINSKEFSPLMKLSYTNSIMDD